MTFDQLGLSDEVLRAVADAGYQKPTPIQEQAIPYVLMGRDILGCAQTGTGKTASFTLPMIDILAQGRAKARMPRSLIITPTRELAAQVAGNFETYGKFNKLTMALLIGGESFGPQVEKLDRGVDVLIATPGRLIDHFERGRILLSDVKILVIDEADRMLDMGFIPDVERIVTFLPVIRQTLFFSATFPPEVRRLADQFLMNPKEISVTPESAAAETVDHFLFQAKGTPEEKRAALRAVLGTEHVTNALVFCNRKRDVDVLARSMKNHGFSAAALHGDMAQAARTETLAEFKDSKITYLVATDVAGRGLDILGLSHVINFDVPLHAEDYIHRIGRTGRAGLRGRAITLATRADAKYVSAIQRLLGKDIPALAVENIAGGESFDNAAEAKASGRRRGGRTRSRAPAKPRQAKSTGTEAKQEKPASIRRGPSKRPSPKPEPSQPEQAARKPEVRPEKVASEAPSRPRRDRGDKKGAVVGLGDHMPAFLARGPGPGKSGS